MFTPLLAQRQPLSIFRTRAIEVISSFPSNFCVDELCVSTRSGLLFDSSATVAAAIVMCCQNLT